MIPNYETRWPLRRTYPLAGSIFGPGYDQISYRGPMSPVSPRRNVSVR